jgi:tetratricopeptide (TPR) repeat protein
LITIKSLTIREPTVLINLAISCGGMLLNYRNFELQFSREASNLYLASALDNGSIAASNTFELQLGELRVIEQLRLIEESVTSEPAKQRHEITVQVKAKGTFHKDFGKELYKKVFAGQLGEYFDKSLKEAQKNRSGLRISLRFNKNAQEIAVLPWEFLHNGDDFLVTNRELLISRLPVEITKIQSPPLESILRMLVVVSNPIAPQITPLNMELEQEVILEAVDRLNREYKMEVDFTEDATFETVESYLNEKEYHIVHFTGHGKYDDNKHGGFLIFESEDGKAREIDNTAIADLFAGRGIRLVVLSACQSGKVSNRETYADLASILVKENIPAVVAMQYSILDLSATKFAQTFYQSVALGKPVDLALTEARIVMKHSEKSNGIDFATPVLYLADPECIKVNEIHPEKPEVPLKPMMLPELQVMKKGFVGRRKELRILQKGFMSDVKRAAIIYGFGGIGKTMLATRLASKMNEYFDGVFGMKCTIATRPEELLNRLNAFLLMGDIQQFNQVLYDANFNLEAKTAVLVSIFNQRQFLIIFDNFEDCLDEARSSIANPEMKFIITTRYNFDPLEGRLTGSLEHISIPELPFPQTVWLMNNHSQLADLEMEKKHRIYKAIGGHPWTVGHFAKLADTLTVDGLMTELEPLKKELINFTLLDKSYSKLDGKTRALFLRTSIYQDAVPVEALSWIIGDEQQPSPSITKELEKLINWGLIAKPEDGIENLFIMHTLVRDFARDELKKEALDRKQLLKRAAQHYENLFVTTKDIWDILKARDYYYEAKEWEKANDIVNNNWECLVRWGYIEHAMNLLNQTIESTEGIAKAAAMGNLASLYINFSDWSTAFTMYSEVKEIFEKERDNYNVAVCLHQLGMIHQHQGSYNKAIKLYQQSLKIRGGLGNKQGIAQTLNNLAAIHHSKGNYGEAIKLSRQNLKVFKELADKQGIAQTLNNLAAIHHSKGNYDEAIKLYQQSLKIREELADKQGIAQTLHNLAAIHHSKGNYDEAIKLYQQSLKIRGELGNKQGITQTLHKLGNIHYMQGNYNEAIKLSRQNLKVFKELGDKHGIATTLYQLGNIHYQQGNYDEAIELCQQSLKINEELGNKQSIALTLGQMGKIYEEKDNNYPAALEKHLIALSIFNELKDPSSKIAENDIVRLREKMGEEAFNKALEEIRRNHGT